MIATTIEQSKHLLELGLDPKTADMSYSEEYFGRDENGNDDWYWKLNACRFIDVEGIIPAWSLTALLEVMPKWTELVKMQSDTQGIYYEIDYMYTGYEDKDAITAAYEMVCWLLENNLIKKGGEQ